MINNKIFDGLNDRQREAVDYLEGPLLVMAGAGSGKTRVLTCRIANLLAHGVAPWNILAITFTNKAANEMKTRAANMIGEPARNVWLSTFHSLCARMLRMDVEPTGIRDRSFVIYDAADSRTMIRNIIKEFELDDKIFNPISVQGTISSVKNTKMLTADQYYDEIISQPNDDSNAKEHDRFVAMIYQQYEKKLKENNALDFDDLLLVAVRMLEQYPNILHKYQDRFKYILIDEYQDTNLVQYQLSKLLAAAHHNICVVGDADQSIYSFRGADIQNILSFEEDYPEAKVVLLEQNYRSTKVILDAANAVIDNNINRKPKELWTSNGLGDNITFIEMPNERNEAQRIVNEIKTLVEKGYKYKDFALLYRMNAQSRALEEAFMQAGIPYVIVGGLKFYERKEIKDIVAYLRVISNLHDSISLQRIINVPKRGVGNLTLAKLNQYASKVSLPLFDVITNVDMLNRTGLTPRSRHGLYEFATFIHDCIERQNELTLANFVLHVLNASGYIKELEDDPTIENQNRLDNLGEFVNVAKEFSYDNPNFGLDEFLNHIALITDLDNLDEDQNNVSLMTIHSAKGLEFPVVFLTGFEEGMLPHSSALMDNDQLEEERRTAYVAITRAKQKLYITSAVNRSIFGTERIQKHSRFFEEIPSELITAANRANRRPVGYEYLNPRLHSPQPPQSTQPSPRKQFVPDTSIGWKAGDKVNHVKWGTGTVQKVTGSGATAVLVVQFDDPAIGKKTLVVKYAPINRI